MAAKRILLVDDELDLLNGWARILRRSGYEVISAAGAHQALEIFRSQPGIEVVLTDIIMPGMRGTDLVREIRRLSPETAFVVMTGGVVPAAELPPGIPLLRKPFLKGDLIAAVEAAQSDGI